MLRRRLILPTVMRGPLRLRADAEPHGTRAKRSPSPRILVILLWLALCAGLYLIGNWPRSSTPPQITATSPAPTVRRPISPPAVSPPPPPTLGLAPQAAPPGALKPLRDESNLAVFGTGLERAADLSGPADKTGPDWPPEEPRSVRDPGAIDDQN